MPRLPCPAAVRFASLLLVVLLAPVVRAANDEPARVHREWTLSSGLASGYRYAAEPAPMPASLRSLRHTATFGAGLWRQRNVGLGLGLRFDVTPWQDRHASTDLYGAPVSVSRRATAAAFTAAARWRTSQRHGMGAEVGLGPSLVIVGWRYDVDAADRRELAGQNTFFTAGLRAEAGLAKRGPNGLVVAIEFGGLLTLPAGHGSVVGNPAGLEALKVGSAVLSVGHTF